MAGHLSCLERTIDGETDVEDLLGSEVLTDGSLSAYDCDDELGNWMDTSGGDSDESMSPHGLGVTDLRFQLDAARAGKHISCLWKCG
jgi:hypothetical protein